VKTLNCKGIIKKLLFVVFRSLVVILSLLITLYFLFRTTGVQTFLARVGAHYLSRELNTEVKIQGLDISLRHGLVIERIKVLDLKHDTLFTAERLGVRPDLLRISSTRIVISRVFVDNGTFQLLLSPGDSLLNIEHIINHFSGPDTLPADTTPSAPLTIQVASIKIKNTRFHYRDGNEPQIPFGMNYGDIDVHDINLDISGIEIQGDTIRANINTLSAREKSGFIAHSFTGKFQVSPVFLKAHDLRIITPHSDLDFSFEFHYPGWRSYLDFLSKVTIHARISPSILDLTDIGFFAPEIRQMQNRFRLTGSIDGTVRNFSAKGLRFSFGDRTLFAGDVAMKGLPSIYNTYADLRIHELHTTFKDLSSFQIPSDPPNLPIPAMVERLGEISLKGSFTGYYDDFVANLQINSQIGAATADLLVTRTEGAKTGYSGRLSGRNLEAGMISGMPASLGQVTFQASLDGKGLSLEDADLKLKLHVDSMVANHYLYHDLDIDGALCRRQFDGTIDVRDPNLELWFKGLLDFRDTVPRFNFSSHISQARLNQLKLVEGDSINELTTSLNVDFTGNTLDNLEGFIRIDSTRYIVNDKEVTMDRFILYTDRDLANNSKSYHLESDFADARILGDFRFTSLVASLSVFLQNYIASFRMRDSLIQEYLPANQIMSYDILLKDTRELTAIYLPFLTIANGTTIRGEYNEKKPGLTLQCRSDLLNVGGVELEGWYLDAETRQHQLALETGSSIIYFKRKTPEDTVQISIDSFQLAARLQHDSLDYDFFWKGQGIPSYFSGYASFHNYPLILTHIGEFDVAVDRRKWSLDTSNYTVIDTSAILFSGLNFFAGDQFLKVNGKISANPADTLSVQFNKVDASRADELLGGGIDLDGSVSGNVRLSGLYEKLSFLSDILIRDFSFNKELLGDATLRVTYESDKSRFDILSEIIYTGNVGKNIPFSLKGSYSTDREHPGMDFKLALKNLNLRMFGPFVSDFMSGLNGLASGEVTIRGTPERPLMDGKVNVKRTEFRISYLNVGYSFADEVHIDSNAIRFNNITLYDSLGHKALFYGAITHNAFQDLRLDLHLDLNDFSAFNNTRAQNNLFYGKARGTGTVAITGPIDKIHIDVRARTGGNTKMTIPIDLTESVGDNDFIVFEQKEGDSLVVVKPKSGQGGTDIFLNLALQVTQDAEVEVFFPDQLGSLKANGTGNLLMTMTPTTPFLMNGTFTLARGSFVFTFRNLLRLPMAIHEGSNISWSGDPADASLNLSATYRTKAPLSGLTSDPQLASIRFNVDCILRLGGRLLNPDIRFGINLPNVEESIRTIVYSAIDTSNVAEMNEQMIYLLVANQFKPVVSGATASFDMGATSVSLLTNQISSILSGISKNVNVGVNYRPATGNSYQEFDVNFSSQFLNDRLLIDGTFGMNSYNSTTLQQTSTVVGDINIEYVLTKNRRWRVHAFNRTNTLSILNNNSPYTQGVGLTYTRNFSSFRELFKPAKKSGETKK